MAWITYSNLSIMVCSRRAWAFMDVNRKPNNWGFTRKTANSLNNRHPSEYLFTWVSFYQCNILVYLQGKGVKITCFFIQTVGGHHFFRPQQSHPRNRCLDGAAARLSRRRLRLRWRRWPLEVAKMTLIEKWVSLPFVSWLLCAGIPNDDLFSWEFWPWALMENRLVYD